MRGGIPSEGIAVLIHNTIVAGPIVATSLTVAKFMVSERALAILSDPETENYLPRVCTCDKAMDVEINATNETSTVHTKGICSVSTMETPVELASDMEDVDEVVAILTQVDLLA